MQMRVDSECGVTGLESPLRSAPNLQASPTPSRVMCEPGITPGNIHASRRAVPIPQDRQQLIREHDVAVLLPFALGDTYGHTLTIDVRGLESANDTDSTRAHNLTLHRFRH
jgi:hypothetical protein